MTTGFTTGKRALGICDRCGLRFLLAYLRQESVRGVQQASLVCRDCFDGDHPQNFQGTQDVTDTQALRNPRPDVAEAAVPPYVPPPVRP